MSNDMISMQEKALAADIRHSLNDKQQLHLDQKRRKPSWCRTGIGRSGLP